MPLSPNKNLKKFYSIQEVAEKYEVKESLLRFWETEFPQLSPRRAGRGIRQYSADDVKLIGVIYDLVKRRGMKIAVAREMLEKNKEGVYRRNEAVEMLQSIRAQLVELRDHLGGVVPGAEYDLEPQKT